MTLSISSNISSEQLDYESIITAYFSLIFIGVFLPTGNLFGRKKTFLVLLFIPMGIILIIQFVTLSFYTELSLLLLSAVISGTLIPHVQSRIINIKEVNLRKIISSDYSLIRFTIPAVSGYLIKVI
jgi:hypothetical protein